MTDGPAQKGVKWSGLPPFAGEMEPFGCVLEPENGGFLRVWRNGGKPAGPFVCAGAGAQGWCNITLHSSISSKKVMEMIAKLLKGFANSAVLQMEAAVAAAPFAVRNGGKA